MRRATLVLAAVLSVCAASADAALVVFPDGRHLKVTSFQVEPDGESIALGLPGGGLLTIALDGVDRILEDEVDWLSPPPPPEPEVSSPRRSVRAPGIPLPEGTPFAREITDAAREFGLDPTLVAAVIRAESNFVSSAVSRKGARGLMQLMPATARHLGVARPFHPRENIRGGTAYLASLAKRYGETEVDLILAAYNAGEGSVEKYGGVPPYRETQGYVRKVVAFWGVGL